MKILIITGGSSSERKISLISARAVKNALETKGHDAVLFDFKKGYPAMKTLLKEFEMVFPVMHGKEGEDGNLYRFLRSLKKPYIGSHPEGAKVAFNKILFKRYCGSKHIPTAHWKIIKTKGDIIRFGFPCVLKAAYGGSSHEVDVLHSKKELSRAQVKKILALPHRCYAEKLIKGPEITAGVLHGKTLPIVEIVPPKGGWFNYKNKYSGESKEIPFAPSVDKKVQKRAQKIALRIHKDLDLGSYSRADFIVENGIPYILEINTPGGVGLTSESLLPKAAKAVGITFEELVERMLEP